MASRQGQPVRVLIVDDSAIVRRVLSDALKEHAGIEVVGTAPDPLIARDKILSLDPDVVTLDIEMPRMDGLTFLRELMRTKPKPVIVISSIAESGSAKALEALHSGAVEVLAKPGGPYSVGELREDLPRKILAAAGARLHRFLSNQAAAHAHAPAGEALPVGVGHSGAQREGHRSDSRSTDSRSADSRSGAMSIPNPLERLRAALPLRPARSFAINESEPAPSLKKPALIAIGASTGGTQAVEAVLRHIPEDCPPVLVTQHIPAGFSASFAARLNQVCAPTVKEAAHGDVLRRGLVLVAPGGHHMRLRRVAQQYSAELDDGPKVCYQRPSVDVLFESVAAYGPSAVLGVILTGMGSDGAKGLLAMRGAGAMTIAESEETCVVFGMPREAIRMNAAQRVLPLHQIAAAFRNV